MAKDLEYYLAQARRIAEHREADAEKEIRKIYKSTLKDVQTFISETYVRHAQDDELTFGMLQAVGYEARFLEEIEGRINLSAPRAKAELASLVEDTYEAAYNGMVKGVQKCAAGAELSDVFADAVAITPEQIKAVVETPISGLTLSDTLEKNRKDIIYDIKRAIGVGLMNGDRYTTMAKRIAEALDGDYKKAVNIARTESHRVREAGNSDAAVKVDEELQNGTTGMRMTKTWKTMKDERVRPQVRRKGKGGWRTTMRGNANHMKMEGQVVLADEAFDLGSGVKAMAPGNSGDAGNDINCRCYASYEMMDDATFYKKTGKHFPKQAEVITWDTKVSDIGLEEAKAMFNEAQNSHYKFDELYEANKDKTLKELFEIRNADATESRYKIVKKNFDEALEKRSKTAKASATATKSVAKKGEHIPFDLDEEPLYGHYQSRTKAQYETMKLQLEKDAGRAMTDREVKNMVDAMDYFVGVDYTHILAAQNNFSGVFGEYASMMSKAKREKALQAAADVEKFLDTAGKYNGTAYRGMAWDVGGSFDTGDWRKLTSDLKVGDTIEFGNSTSWTKKEGFVRNIYDARTGYDDEATGQVWLEIILPDSKTGVDISERYPINPGQGEVTFPSNAGFKVTKVETTIADKADYKDGITQYKVWVEEV